MGAIPTCRTIHKRPLCLRNRALALVTVASAAVVVSEVGLLREDQGIVYLDPEVPDRALQLRVTKQELAGP